MDNKINGKNTTINSTNNIVAKIVVTNNFVVNNLSKLYIFYCKNLNLKIPLTPFQLGDLFNVRASTLKSLKPFLVYQFIRLNCKACYIKETIFHLTKRIKEHFETDKTSC